VSVAVVPVKQLAASKSRLIPELARDELEALALAMVEDVLAALVATPEIDRVTVATPDERVAAVAHGLGAEALLGPDPGLNEAIESAAPRLGLGEDEPLLVVLGDVAGVLPAELSLLFAALSEMPMGAAAVLAPSRDGGTSALLRRPCDALPARFGPDSTTRHREAAAEFGVPLRILELPSLSIDLDHRDDVERFLERHTGGLRTRALLAQLGWSPLSLSDIP
jgi:2-phospho-L-lactate guanylyltransferase